MRFFYLLFNGKLGDWKIEKFTVTKKEAQFYNIGLMFKPGGSSQCILPGNYTRLMHKGHVVMSDTPAEIRSHLSVINRAKGNVLLNGLGLGVVLGAILGKEEVNHVTVVEISQDVVDLVGPYYLENANGKLTIVVADALKWRPKLGTKFDVVWHDIWNDISSFSDITNF